MDQNEQIIIKFLESFSQRDFDEMNKMYSDEIVYFDPKIGLIREGMVKNLWKNQFENAKNFSFTYGDVVKVDDEYYTCENLILYRHPQTNRIMKDKRKSFFRMENGKIVEQSDAFKLYGWNRQAFGISGWILGWNTAFQKRVRNKILREL